MAQKKIPARQCIGCMTSRPKKELVRVVRAPSGEISIDLVGKKPGRGAYLCPDPACLAKAKKKKALERCFEQPVPAEVYEALEAQLTEAAKEAARNAEKESHPRKTCAGPGRSPVPGREPVPQGRCADHGL